MKPKELVAASLALCIAVPLVFFFARALADGERERRESPLRAFFGDEEYEQLTQGLRTSLHYMGNDRLAPDFVLKDQHGRPFQLRKQRGKVVVLNVWTITCQPCLEEMPSLVQLAEMAANRDDLVVASISTDRQWSSVHTAVPRRSKLTVLLDPDKRVVRGKFGTRMYPETWIIDPDGVIRLRIDGPRDWSSPIALEVLESLL